MRPPPPAATRRLACATIASAALLVGSTAAWLLARTDDPPASSAPPAPRAAPAVAAAPVEPAGVVEPAAPVRPAAPEPPRRACAPVDDPPSRDGAAELLTDAAEARRRGDLRLTLALLQAAVEREPGAETHGALGALYLEMAVTGAAVRHLRAAVEADPGNADRWIALANALALEPDPMAAADALARARAAEPGLRVSRGVGGWLVREPSP